MFRKVLTWILLLNLLNTLFFAEVPASRHHSEKARVTATGADAVIDSLVEFVIGYWLDQPDLMAEEDFDDIPDHLKGNKFLEFFLLPPPAFYSVFSVAHACLYGTFQEPLPSLSYDVVSPPPQA